MSQTPTFLDRIEAIRQQKLRHTDEKLKTLGSYNIDDHGWIPSPTPIEIEQVLNPETGKTNGMKAVGATFRRYLEANPPYVCPQSACAGAWYGYVPGSPWRDEHLAEHLHVMHKKYNMIVYGVYGMNHVSTDLKIGFDLGWGGMLEKVRYYRKKNNPTDTSFYDGEEDLILGIQDMVRRNAQHAREMSGSATGAWEKQNLLDIADMNDWLVENPPRTLREAVQFFCHFQSVDRMYGAGGASQQIDTLFFPFYESDKKAGLIKDDMEVTWFLASMLFNDTHYHAIGGQDPADGHDITTPISFCMLDAMHYLNIPSNVALRVHEGMNEELFDKAVRYLFEDGTGVDYSCAKGLEEGYMKLGRSLFHARARVKVGCNWTAIPGLEYGLQDVTRLCMATPFTMAMDDMMAADEEKSLANLWKHYVKHMEIAVDVIKQGFDWHCKYKWQNSPEIVLNLFMYGPIERGLDMSNGGVDIVNFACDGLALATIADSFAAIEQRVVNEGRITWDELYACLKNNWKDAEPTRLMMQNIERFGAGDSLADDWAEKVSGLFTDLMISTPLPETKYPIIPGLFSHGDVLSHGKAVAATPNGRFDGDPISHSADPDPGFMLGGASAPTAKSTAVARVQSGFGNSAPLQIDIDSKLAEDMGGVEIIKAYIRAHNDLGGTLININIVSKDKILAAHEDPSKFPDLVVRVTGYSAFFKSLSKEYRQQIIDRLLA